MNRKRNGRSAAYYRLQVLLLALLLALFGAPALAQGNAQQDDSAEAQQEGAAQQEAAGDQTVIQLGPDEVITESEFEQEFERATRALALQQGLPYNEETREIFDPFRADFLDQLAIRNALLMEAEALDITVSDDEVEQQLTQARESLGAEQFEQAVEDLGYDSVDAYRESVREGLLTQQVIDELQADIEVTDEQIQTFFDENQDLFGGQELDQVREQVRAQLVNERLTKQFAELRQEHGIETFPERIAATTGPDDGVAGGGEAETPEGEVDPDVVQPEDDAPFSEEDVEPDEVPAVEDVEGDRDEEGLGEGETDPQDDQQQDDSQNDQ